MIGINIYSQCEIEITNTYFDIDTSKKIIQNTISKDVCIKYLVKKKNVTIYANNQLGEVQNIESYTKNNEYTEVNVINKYGVKIRYRFYKNLVKLETLVSINITLIVEKGNGLNYKISYWMK